MSAERLCERSPLTLALNFKKMQLNEREICPGIWIPASYGVRKQSVVPRDLRGSSCPKSSRFIMLAAAARSICTLSTVTMTLTLLLFKLTLSKPLIWAETQQLRFWPGVKKKSIHQPIPVQYQFKTSCGPSFPLVWKAQQNVICHLSADNTRKKEGMQCKVAFWT